MLMKNFTKYSGMTLGALEFLATTTAPVNEKKKMEVWSELFHRYFNLERNFNLYDLLLKLPDGKEKSLYISKAMILELQREKTSIPVHHSESFMKNVLSFMGFMEKLVNSQENSKFEWQIHGLSGISDLLEKIRDAKIKDINLRQKINLFIDKINNARKDTLEKIEKQEEMISADSEVSAALVLTKEEKAIMKQELKHLSLPLSKTNQKTFESILHSIHLYYPEDQFKILERGLKKYPSITLPKEPWKCFVLNIDKKIPDIDMARLLNGIFNGLNGIGSIRLYGEIWNFKDLVSSGEVNDFFSFIEEWYLSSENSTVQGWKFFKLALSRRLDLNEYLEYYTGLLKESFELFEKFRGRNLSELLEETIDVTIVPIEKLPRERFEEVSVSIIYNKEKQGWVAKEAHWHNKPISAFEYYMRLLEIFDKTIDKESFDCQGNGMDRVSNPLSSNFSRLLRDFKDLGLSFVVDSKILENVSVDRKIRNEKMGLTLTSEDTTFLEFFRNFTRYKFSKNALNKDEIRLFYKDAVPLLKEVVMHSIFRDENDEYFTAFFKEGMDFYSLSDEDDKKQFFALPFKGEDFFASNNKTMSLAVGEKLILKIKNEIPHEYALISEFFDEMGEEQVIFELFDEYKGLSAIEQLLLMSNNIQIGQETKTYGVKTKENGKEVCYSEEEIRNKFVIDYFKMTYPYKPRNTNPWSENW